MPYVSVPAIKNGSIGVQNIEEILNNCIDKYQLRIIDGKFVIIGDTTYYNLSTKLYEDKNPFSIYST